MYLNDPERRMENLICTEGFERALVLKAPWGVLAFVMLTVFPGLSMNNAIPLADSSEIENSCPVSNFDWIKNDSMPAEPYFSYLWYCWWFRNPKQPPGMVQKPLVSNGIKRRIWFHWPRLGGSTVESFKFLHYAKENVKCPQNEWSKELHQVTSLLFFLMFGRLIDVFKPLFPLSRVCLGELT